INLPRDLTQIHDNSYVPRLSSPTAKIPKSCKRAAHRKITTAIPIEVTGIERFTAGRSPWWSIIESKHAILSRIFQIPRGFAFGELCFCWEQT
ncbi:MAG: hypothetical protein ABI970_20600, partial [Chloroflexota bacterium]